jgi:glycosyltransferase involved in cell wall biosynthesis
MPNISAVVIALNEAHRIRAAVTSVAPWVDEVLVVDGGSTDGTADLARDAGARVELHAFEGFVAQKQYATDRAAHDLVFSLDADERVDIELGASLRAAAGASHAGWRLRRRNYLDGAPLRASGWYPDWRVRLFDRGRARWAGSDPHDVVHVDGSVGRLPGHLHHDPDRDLDAFVAGTRAHAERRARSLFEEGVRPGRWTPWLHGGAHLMRKMTVGAAWLDGRRGLQVAWIGAGGVITKYQRAAELSEER